MATVPVKLNANGEIRRFGIELVDGTASFANLIEKVFRLYPEFTSVKLAWKDNDDDLVAIINDEDLTEARRNMAGNVMQIYLVASENKSMVVNESLTGKQGVPKEIPSMNDAKEEGPSDQTGMALDERTDKLIDGQDPVVHITVTCDEQMGTTKKEQDPTIHIGVTCDGCKGAVKGLRYKCLICPDYDLCETCVQNRVHYEHSMIRIDSPQDKSWIRGFMASKFMCHPRRMPWRRSCHHGPSNLSPHPKEEPKSDDQTSDCTNEELIFIPAIGEIVSAALTSMGIEPQLYAESSGKNSSSIHVGVTCDACEGIVDGLRYKCMTCPNYDLCESCEAKHLHDEHPMIRIASPTNKSWRKGFYAAQYPFLAHYWKSKHQRHALNKPCGQASNNNEYGKETTENKNDTDNTTEQNSKTDVVQEQQQRHWCHRSCERPNYKWKHCSHRHGQRVHACSQQAYTTEPKSDESSTKQRSTNKQLVLSDIEKVISAALTSVGIEPQFTSAEHSESTAEQDGKSNENVQQPLNLESLKKAFDQMLALGSNK